ncbi:uncharacterized protein BYT42DRAFT_578974 [Radiomyces spectabilis]|uniref:uncharacterized protein n=1 Tax=Radiomyces spectabilis TaxID=64574 RepID=UPI00221F3550|nr:uncharacterized protein BYT42DRAFT_578974 [Radiomyces spectabilis]KAI8373034.1 hypothetical protein BYT42DRAFT_578974 [Radiomyces spectabilis]
MELGHIAVVTTLIMNMFIDRSLLQDTTTCFCVSIFFCTYVAIYKCIHVSFFTVYGFGIIIWDGGVVFFLLLFDWVSCISVSVHVIDGCGRPGGRVSC